MQSRRRGSNRGARLIRRLVAAYFAEARAAAERAAHSAREHLGGYPHSHYLGLANLEPGVASAGAGAIRPARRLSGYRVAAITSAAFSTRIRFASTARCAAPQTRAVSHAVCTSGSANTSTVTAR